MKKWIYFLALAATFSLAASCKGKDKDKGIDDDGDPDMTWVTTHQGGFLG